MKIAFHTPTIDVRGTCVALYDYAYYNESILGNTSIIISESEKNHDIEALVKFGRRFRVIFYKSIEDLDKILVDNNCNILYTIKYGKKDHVVSHKIKTVVHCVFDMSEPHGDVYAGVSETLAKKFNQTKFVPHMIGLKPSFSQDNMRNYLRIPVSATVLGRHGGLDTADLDIAMRAMHRAVQTRHDLYFVFVNTPRFLIHPRMIHLDKIADLDEKNRFICTCDGMIHFQRLGETFGLAIGEFSINNKPVITYGGNVWNDNYKSILGNKALYYHTEEECYQILINFDRSKYQELDLNCYKAFSPEKVMEKFKEVFLD